MLDYISRIIPVTPATLASVATSASSQPDYSLPDLILMTVYVAATLVLGGVTIWQARAILAASAKQSQGAINAVHEQIEASKAQSQAAIDAVHEQIEASKVQSQAAIEAIYKQIEASDRQAQEAFQNQYKPVIVPTMDGIKLSDRFPLVEVNIENVGPGIALTIWGTLAIEDTGKYYSSMSAKFLTPNERMLIGFVNQEHVEQGGVRYVQYPYNEFFETPTRNEATEIYPLFPADNIGGVYKIRLILTYKDIFENKYLAIFDRTDELGWKQVVLKKTKQTMDEIAYRIYQRDFVH